MPGSNRFDVDHASEPPPPPPPPLLAWRNLPPATRAVLSNKIGGIYGHDGDQRAFDALTVDKQQAVLIFAGRLNHLKLWDAVRRIENVYGVGGVGMTFEAWPVLCSTLTRHAHFTTLLAGHSDSAKGFYERRRSRAALHFLYIEAGKRAWSVHFDYYAPLASPFGALRHLYYESLRAQNPDWRAVKSALVSDTGRQHRFA